MSYEISRRGLITGTLATGVAAGLGVDPAAAAARERGLKLSTANVGLESTPRVGSILSGQRPHVMVLSEAENARSHLSALADRHGYRLKQYTRKHGDLAPEIAFLIRDDVTILQRRLLKMTERWRFKRWREPRRYQAFKVRHNGATWWVIGIHFPPMGYLREANQQAWRESRMRIQRFAHSHPNHPVIAVGDFNKLAPAVDDAFPRFTTKLGSHKTHAISINGRGDRFGRKRRHEPKPKGGNGHGWVTFNLWQAV
ncbi:endonuclease/exonuclease/phosphatase family protein [Georgenia alba]|uniref:Endonuclease/exonuclease/phosphatase family protein n=1 Tax=Georgenia alba TaxID=2233858 RepID=A0ABW2QE85_9MICO